ncbi:unnamed protein product [Allacma fusca]|uniref:Uncharacterized protein n=1 Tax=Allacma fusca TaxID=39272 RepID=A0A8J2PFM6_9HEXA|nr:unnamed protein product [Allacma fusca]
MHRSQKQLGKSIGPKNNSEKASVPKTTRKKHRSPKQLEKCIGPKNNSEKASVTKTTPKMHLIQKQPKKNQRTVVNPKSAGFD